MSIPPRVSRPLVLCVCLVWSLAGAVACTSDTTAQVPMCRDGFLDYTETDVDCGGGCPDKCADGKTCGGDGDCQSGRCVEAICAPAPSASAPTVTTLTPGFGPEEGGTEVSIVGTGFVLPLTVLFGAREATDVKVLSETRLTVKTPAGAAGPVDVTVIRSNGLEGSLVGAFVYAAGMGPVVSQVLPTSGLTTGGTRGVLAGRGFDAGARLYFGGQEAANVRVLDPTRIVFTTPPNREGMVDIVVMNPGARAGILRQAFHFYPPDGTGPMLAAVQPSWLPLGAVVSVTALGERLGDAETLVFLGDAQAAVEQASDGALVFAVPAQLPVGQYDVTVTTVRGQSATLPKSFELTPPACSDGVRNGTETDIDCGGSCSGCATDELCSLDPDCVSLVCVNDRCAAPLCSDRVKNGHETDIDCGGSCSGCATNAICAGAADCASHVCLNGRCVAPTCVDHVKNGEEADIDCGGACAGCGTNATCVNPVDCASLVCANGFCVAPVCNDHVRNGTETDVDCGGSCLGCATNGRCARDPDCLSLVCAGGSCAAATCSDRVKNGNETDLDCGGSCGPCATHSNCSTGSDCVSLSCLSGKCAAPTCTDHVRNGSETDVDCSGSCSACATGATCSTGSDCVSRVCSGGRCAAATCADHVQNGTETDVDCGGDCGACSGCSVDAAHGGGALAHRATRVGYSAASVPCAAVCSSVQGTMTCNNGVMDFGGTASSTCSTAACASCANPGGGTTVHDAVLTAYQSGNACGGSCVPEYRTCKNGSWSPSPFTYTSLSCTTTCCPGPSCTAADAIAENPVHAVINPSPTGACTAGSSVTTNITLPAGVGRVLIRLYGGRGSVAGGGGAGVRGDVGGIIAVAGGGGGSAIGGMPYTQANVPVYPSSAGLGFAGAVITGHTRTAAQPNGTLTGTGGGGAGYAPYNLPATAGGVGNVAGENGVGYRCEGFRPGGVRAGGISSQGGQPYVSAATSLVGGFAGVVQDFRVNMMYAFELVGAGGGAGYGGGGGAAGMGVNVAPCYSPGVNSPGGGGGSYVHPMTFDTTDGGLGVTTAVSGMELSLTLGCIGVWPYPSTNSPGATGIVEY